MLTRTALGLRIDANSEIPIKITDLRSVYASHDETLRMIAGRTGAPNFRQFSGCLRRGPDRSPFFRDREPKFADGPDPCGHVRARNIHLPLELTLCSCVSYGSTWRKQVSKQRKAVIIIPSPPPHPPPTAARPRQFGRLHFALPVLRDDCTVISGWSSISALLDDDDCRSACKASTNPPLALMTCGGS